MRRTAFSVGVIFLLVVTGFPEESAIDARLEKLLVKFPESDLNGDGQLTTEEFKAYRASVSSPSEAEKRTRSGDTRITGAELVDRFEAEEYLGVPYRFFQPTSKESESDQLFPLILSLHGAGGKGSDNVRNLKHWNAIVTEPDFQAEYPCYVVVPQSTGPWRTNEPVPDFEASKLPPIWQTLLSSRRSWLEEAPGGTLHLVFDLLDEIAESHPVDQNRVYVLGHSMGGFGSFEAVALAPDRFAAAIPSAGGLLPWHRVESFKHVPIWAFHGVDDGTVPYRLSELVLEQMEGVGGNYKLTRLEGVGHGAATYAFIWEGDDEDQGFTTFSASDQVDPTESVWDWLFAQRRQ
ncbi:MAG: prolyl oligopeptidase family serine peptidase [Verrucomicrobiota bacterium]